MPFIYFIRRCIPFWYDFVHINLNLKSNHSHKSGKIVLHFYTFYEITSVCEKWHLLIV